MSISPSSGQWLLALGGNIGPVRERAGTIVDACHDLSVIAKSPWFKTAPVGPRQADFWNAVWIIDSRFGPHQLLEVLWRLEHKAGRARGQHWGPRTLDLDLILGAQRQRIQTPVLTIPHPRWRQRSFVAVPAALIAPDWIDPETGEPVAVIAKRLSAFHFT